MPYLRLFMIYLLHKHLTWAFKFQKKFQQVREK